MHSLTDIFLRIPFLVWIVLISCAVALAAICMRAFEIEESRAKRAEQNKKKELQSLAERISGYGAQCSSTLSGTSVSNHGHQ